MRGCILLQLEIIIDKVYKYVKRTLLSSLGVFSWNPNQARSARAHIGHVNLQLQEPQSSSQRQKPKYDM